MDTAPQWPQDIVVVKAMEPNMNASSLERKARAHKEQAFNCPRCNSTNTKFCYYNNYSLSQPRFFCKACRRYWTEGGSLRNIPVGGASRKNKRSISSSSSSSTISTSSSSSSYINNNNNNNNIFKKVPHDLVPPHHQNPKTQDLIFENTLDLQNHNSSTSSLSSRVLYNNYDFMPLPVVGSGFHQFNKSSSSSLSFSLEHGGLGGNYGIFQGLQENNNSTTTSSSNKLLFPFEDLKHDHQDHHVVTNNVNNGDRQTKDHDHQNGDPTNGFWNGVIGGGSCDWRKDATKSLLLSGKEKARGSPCC